MKKLFLSIFLAAALLIFASPLPAQTQFVRKNLYCPGSPTVGARTAFADMDNDGDEDFAGPAIDGSTLLIYRNQNGLIDTFPQRIPTILPYQEDYPSDFLLTDWNLDGLPDWIQIQGKDIGRFYLLLNLGGFAFSEPVLLFSHGVFDVSASFGAKDLNNDGYPDLYSIQEFPLVFFNHAGQPAGELITGSFSGTAFSSGAWFNGVFLDYDANGTLDFVGRERLSAPSTQHLIVFQDLGDFHFEQVEVLWDNPGFINAADLNNDGADEVLFRASSGDFHAMFYNPSTQAWEDKFIGMTQFSNGGGFSGNYDLQWSYPVADIDANGFLDFAFGNQVFFNNGNFQFTRTQLSANPNYAFPSLIIADPDQDGKKEIWWATEQAGLYLEPSGVFRYEYDSGQLFFPRERLWTMYPLGGQWFGTFLPSVILDANLDGQPDAAYFTNGGIALSTSQNGVFTDKLIANAYCADCLYGLRKMDVDGDGQEDLLILDQTGAVWLKKTGPVTYDPPIRILFPGLSFPAQPRASHDFDNDGLQDLIVWSMQIGVNRWAYVKNLGNGNFQAVAEGHLDYLFLPELSIDDFNGDGYDDFLIYEGSPYSAVYAGAAYAFVNDGGAGFNLSASVGATFGCGLADVTADGKKDIILLFQPDELIQSQSTICRPSNGDGTFGEPITLDEGVWRGDQNHVMFDVNNDGLDDLVGDDGLTVAINYGTGFGPSYYQGDYTGYVFGDVADFDNDGDLDIAADYHPLSYWENVAVGSYRIEGRVFFDANGNGQYDQGETSVAGIKTGIDSLQIYAVSDSSGHFSIPTGSAKGSLKVALLSEYNDAFTFTTPHPASAELSDAHPLDTVLIGLQPVGGATATLGQALSSHRCDETARLWLAITPVTAGPADGELRLHFPAGLAWVNLDSLPGIVVQGQEIRWPLSQLPSLAGLSLWADFIMPGYQHSGDTLRFTAELMLRHGADSVTVRDTLLSLLTCAYDPNDKQFVNFSQFLQGDTYYTLIAPDEMEYIIRFQNTGNDTAFQVSILDNLAPWFDYRSFRFLGASHPCRASLDATGLLRVEFPGIALPDSTSNFTGSMGYFKFALALQPDPPRNQRIRNSARILFGQNPPVFTNVAAFQIVDCSYFVSEYTLPDLACEGDAYPLTVPGHGLEQSYQWIHNGELVSQSDTAWVTVTGEDNLVHLEVQNALCQADTTFYFHSNGPYPILQLSPDSSLAICAGTTIEITSNLNAEWYRNDTLVQVSGTSYTAAAAQVLRVVSSIPGQPCRAERTIGITAVDIPAGLIEEGAPELPFVRCAGGIVTLSTTLAGGFQWYLYDNLAGEAEVYSTNAISFPIDSVPDAYVELRLDTLNCSATDYRYAQAIPPGDLQLTGDSVFCDAVPALSFYSEVGGVQLFVDSVLVYQDGELAEVHYGSAEFAVQAEAGISFTIEVFVDCLHETFFRTFQHFDSASVGIIRSNDTLFTSNGAGAFWYYAPSANSGFEYLPDAFQFVAQPANGYYYLYYGLDNCYGYSDTLHYQLLAPSEPTAASGAYFDPGTRALILPGAIPAGARYFVFDMAGRLLDERPLGHYNPLGQLPAGMYLCVIWQSNQSFVLKWASLQ
ncbi:MAG: hypothetical protein KDD19_07275 [Phaeodactylibacter sp.]|nr:hypothetical protein [Phaeodactylibacter sp.]MCB9051581.1 hypothetical protein [Lewinellaceae bacterium]